MTAQSQADLCWREGALTEHPEHTATQESQMDMTEIEDSQVRR
jgi:hypothetical protein